MKFNEPDQEFHVIAFDENGRVSGDATNITCELAIDGGDRDPVGDTNPVEIGTTGEYVFDLTQAETNGHALSFTPASSTSGVQVLGIPANVIYTTLEDAIKAKTDLLTSTADLISPVSQAGRLKFLIIGDDYTAANGMAIAWTITPPTGTTVAGASCFFGGSAVETPTVSAWLVEGTVTDAGSGLMTISFDLARTDTELLSPGQYNWSAEIRNDADLETTSVRSGNNEVSLILKQT